MDRHVIYSCYVKKEKGFPQNYKEDIYIAMLSKIILGVSGSGKSFTAKNEITNLILGTDADIIIVDPEREYAPLIRALGGSVINNKMKRLIGGERQKDALTAELKRVMMSS